MTPNFSPATSGSRSSSRCGALATDTSTCCSSQPALSLIAEADTYWALEDLKREGQDPVSTGVSVHPPKRGSPPWK